MPAKNPFQVTPITSVCTLSTRQYSPYLAHSPSSHPPTGPSLPSPCPHQLPHSYKITPPMPRPILGPFYQQTHVMSKHSFCSTDHLLFLLVERLYCGLKIGWISSSITTTQSCGWRRETAMKTSSQVQTINTEINRYFTVNKVLDMVQNLCYLDHHDHNGYREVRAATERGQASPFSTSGEEERNSFPLAREGV